MSTFAKTSRGIDTIPVKAWDTKLPNGQEGEYTFVPSLGPPAAEGSQAAASSGYGKTFAPTSPAKPLPPGAKQDKFSAFSPHIDRATAESLVQKHTAEETFNPDLPKWNTSEELRRKAQSSGYGDAPVSVEDATKRAVEVHLTRPTIPAGPTYPSNEAAAAQEGLVLAPDGLLAGKPVYNFQPDQVALPTKTGFKLKQTTASSGYGSAAYIPTTKKTKLRGETARKAAEKKNPDQFHSKFKQEKLLTFKPQLHLSKTAKRLARKEEAKRKAFGMLTRHHTYSPEVEPEEQDGDGHGPE